MTSPVNGTGIAQACKIAFFVVLFSQLFLSAYYPAIADTPGMRLAVAAIVGVIALVWARADARVRGLQLPTPLGVGIVLLAALFVPVWLFRSRPPQEAGWAIARFTGWLVAMIVFFSFGASALEQLGVPVAFDGATNR